MTKSQAQFILDTKKIKEGDVVYHKKDRQKEFPILYSYAGLLEFKDQNEIDGFQLLPINDEMNIETINDIENFVLYAKKI